MVTLELSKLNTADHTIKFKFRYYLKQVKNFLSTDFIDFDSLRVTQFEVNPQWAL